MTNVIAEWQGREFEHSPKSADWYWALGIITVAGAIASILFGNYLLAVLILIAATAIALHAAKEPPIHTFKLVEKGLVIDTDLHSFDRMISFSVFEDISGELPPLLSIKSDSWHSPHIVIPLKDIDVDLLYAYFLERVDEHEHHPSLIDVVAAWVGF